MGLRRIDESPKPLSPDEWCRREMRELKVDLKDCVNELCYQCGQYRHEHEGACDGCRWKPFRHRDWSASE